MSAVSDRCPIGSLGLHTYDYDRTECIWCGPNKLAWKPGKWANRESDKSAAWLPDKAAEA